MVTIRIKFMGSVTFLFMIQNRLKDFKDSSSRRIWTFVFPSTLVDLITFCSNGVLTDHGENSVMINCWSSVLNYETYLINIRNKSVRTSQKTHCVSIAEID
jgi:hypothetical protein